MNNAFFQSIHYKRWAPVLDWLASGTLLDGVEKRKFTSLMKRSKYFIDQSYHIGKAKSYPSGARGFCVEASGSGTEDFIRHIRNGIMHGRARVGSKYIELTDKYGRKQTAYIKVPIEFVLELFDIYKDLMAK